MTGTAELSAGPPPASRVLQRSRAVRVGDASPAGRLRLDAAARYLQDVSADDTAEIDLPGRDHWVVRRLTMQVGRFPVLREPLTLRTWCAAYGSHHAERRVEVRGAGGGSIDAAVLWVHVDPASGRPARLPDAFADHYGPSAGPSPSTRLRLPGPPPDGDRRAWPLRFTDFDALGHVNNAVYWAPVEEELARRRDLRAPLRATVEHRGSLAPGACPEVVAQDGPGSALRVWVLDGSSVVAAVALDAVADQSSGRRS